MCGVRQVTWQSPLFESPFLQTDDWPVTAAVAWAWNVSPPGQVTGTLFSVWVRVSPAGTALNVSEVPIVPLGPTISIVMSSAAGPVFWAVPLMLTVAPPQTAWVDGEQVASTAASCRQPTL